MNTGSTELFDSEGGPYGWLKHGAYGVFMLSISRINALLKAGTQGIEGEKKSITELHTKIADGIAAGGEEDTDPDGPKSKLLEDGSFQIKLTGDEARLLERAMSAHVMLVGDLDAHFNNILCVAVWGAFEGYIQGSMLEFFLAQPDLLASNKQISVREVVDAKDSIVELLARREVDDIGRKSFLDLQLYLRGRIKLQFSEQHSKRLVELYFLRNVIAHSAGFLRKDQLSSVPEGVTVKDDQLKIGQPYLVDSIKCVEDAVQHFDRRLKAKLQKSHDG